MSIQETVALIQQYKSNVTESMETWEKKYLLELLAELENHIQSNEYETIETIYKRFDRSFYCELPSSDQLRDIVKSYYLNTLKPAHDAEQKRILKEKRRHDYTIELESLYKVWLAEITGEGGQYGLERRFLDNEEREYLSAWSEKRRTVSFFCKNGKIYESYRATSRRNSERLFHFNSHEYETYEQALKAKQESEVPAGEQKQQITHSQFMKLAWKLAKKLAGGSKGSRAKLSQAMKELNQQFIH